VTEDRQPFGEDDLMAYVDERLPEGRRAAVERFVDENPTVRAQVSADRAARESLRQRLNPIADLPIPARLRIDAILRLRGDTLRWRLQAAAAGVMLLLGGGAAGWKAHEFAPPSTTFTQQAALATTATDAISAHRIFVVETVHPVEVGAAQEKHLIQWLSRRVGHPLAVPDLAAQGYVLMGGRVLPAGNEAAAQFMYESKLGHRLTVYVRASSGGDTQFRFVDSRGVSAFSWIDQGLGFAIVSAIDRPQLLDIADTVYQQVDPQHRTAPAES
jgi:anti-sigma factor RsiW